MASQGVQPSDLQKSLVNLGLAPTDYDQWERRTRRIAKSAGKGRESSRRLTDESALAGSSPVVGPQPHESSAKQFHHYRGPACAHHHKSKSRTTPAEEEDESLKERQRENKVLELLIKSRRKALANYKARQETLLEENTKLREEIEGKEKEVHNEVKSLLRKYERFRGAVSTLTSKFETEKALARKAYEEAKAKVLKEVEALERQGQALDDKLQERKTELSVLMSYKDKEYPVRAMKIAELQRQIQYLSSEYEAEINDLSSITAIEKEKYHQDSEERLHAIKETVTDNAIDSMHDSLKEMAMQNIVMRKEIEGHHKLLEELEATIGDLTEEVSQLRADPKTNTRRVMFPHLFNEIPKCTPDMDVMLDIPTQQWLPI
ncbi:uncharacterized protein C20orf96-like [Acanthaster planci]|uniref:Uncharacterized protein C20orf96-like n=1 Tax=Acanthaster planci TaxID=133434 RepID=A0A8B7ZRM4_ACAPL|nr:uncharacterized protein C20orf96-like [Acanthaster planci]